MSDQNTNSTERLLQWQKEKAVAENPRVAKKAERAVAPAATPEANLLSLAATASRLTDAIIVGVSCGKDSAATLDVCSRHFLNVHAYFMYLVKGLEFQEKYLCYLEGKYGISIMRIPHWNLSAMFKYGWLRNHSESMMSVPLIKLIDAESYVKEKLSCEWIAYGHRAQESLERNAMLKKNGGIDLKGKRVYPLTFWSKKHVVKYLDKNKIPLAPEYRFLGRSFGAFLEPQLLVIKQHWPNDSDKIKEVFPYVEAIIKRKEFTDKQIPEI